MAEPSRPAVAQATPNSPASSAAIVPPADPIINDEPDEKSPPAVTPSRAVAGAGAGATTTSEPLGSGGGLLPDDDEDEASAIAPPTQTLQPLGTRTMTAASALDPIETGPSLGDKISEVTDDCTQTGKSCRAAFNQTLGISLTAAVIGVTLLAALGYYLHKRRRRKQADKLELARVQAKP